MILYSVVKIFLRAARAGVAKAKYFKKVFSQVQKEITKGTIASGHDIGAGGLMGGDTVAVYPFTGPDLGRDYPFVMDEYGNFGNETEFLVTDGGTHVADILVMKLDALVQGRVLDQNGMPLNGYVYAFSEIDTMLYIDSESPVDENGFYRFWAMNGTEVNIYFEAEEDDFLDDALFLEGGLFDESLGAYVYNYDIQSTPPFATVQGYAFAEMWNEESMVMDTMYLPGVEVSIYNENDYFSRTSPALSTKVITIG